MTKTQLITIIKHFDNATQPGVRLNRQDCYIIQSDLEALIKLAESLPEEEKQSETTKDS